MEMERRRRITRVVDTSNVRYQIACALTISLCFSILSSLTLAQIQPGSMVNMDCGISTPYIETRFNQTWVPDDPYVVTGVKKQLNVSNMRDLGNLRYFPESRKKSCYVLPVAIGGRYFIRGRFYHGGYDGNTAPSGLSFNVSIEATSVFVVSILNVTSIYEFAHIVQTTKNTIFVCLVRNSPVESGNPFISSIQYVTLAPGMYPEVQDTVGLRYLSLVARQNYGSVGTGAFRYPQDPYDRNWRNDGLANTPFAMSTDQVVTNAAAYNQPPSVIMQTAKLGGNETFSRLNTVSNNYVLYLYFAEIQNGTTIGSRVFDILVNNFPWITNFDILANRSGAMYESMQLTMLIESSVPSFTMTLIKSAGSLQEPLINAAEVLQRSEIVDLRTFDQDVLGVESIKKAFGLVNWTGDPCMPVPYDWITCNSHSPARVVKVQLKNMGLVGSIPSGIANLTALELLDLRNNALTGDVPESVLSLTGLTIQVAGNPLFKCPNSQCTITTNGEKSEGGKASSNTRVLISAITSGAGVAVLICLCILFICMRRRKRNEERRNDDNVSQKLVSTHPLEQHSEIQSLSSGNSPRTTRSQTSANAPTKNSEVSVLTPLEVFNGSLYQKSNSNSKTSKEGCSNSSRSLHSNSSVGKISIQQDVKNYTWEEVLVMTNDNKIELGKGGFGLVYLGNLMDGREVAVKILSATSHQGIREFLNEVDLLSRVNHGNLVKLLGYCQEPEQVLIYEYAEEGTLREHLYGRRKGQKRDLNFEVRLNIAVSSACGIEYLHTGCRPSIIHRDIKSSNILLTKNMIAKVADFGLSKLGPDGGHVNQTHVSTMVKGTVGYIDPDYFTSNQLTYKSDVFSFGVVLMEIITGRMPIQACLDSSERYIGNWVRERYKGDEIANIADPTLNGEYNLRAMRLVISLALKCMSQQGADRPDMSEVVQELRTAAKLEKGTLMNAPDLMSAGSEDLYCSKLFPPSLNTSSVYTSSFQYSIDSDSVPTRELV